jgi:hypothetical protein
MESRFDRIELERAIDALYDVFGRYPLKGQIDTCPHCQLEGAERLLHTRPLRELTWVELRPFASKALTTFGDENDFRHFLPRVLELYARDALGAPPHLFMFCNKLDYAGWTAWPPDEVAAVRSFLDAWKRVLTARVHDSEDGALELEELTSGMSVL